MKENLEQNIDPIKLCEEKYPEMTKEFKKILKEQYEIFCRKQLNYGPDNISGGTSLRTDDDIKFSLMGLFFRMNDKVQRLKQLVVLGNQDTVGESIDDTYQDLSVYGIIAQIVKRKKWGL
jgi:Nucleotide modification associated domain 1